MTEDEEEKAREEQVQKALQDEIDRAWSALLQQPAGRLILWSILDKCGLQNFPVLGEPWDTINKGRQQIGNEILEECVYPVGMSVYTQMLLEAEERDQRLQAAIDQDDAEQEEESDR